MRNVMPEKLKARSLQQPGKSVQAVCRFMIVNPREECGHDQGRLGSVRHLTKRTKQLPREGRVGIEFGCEHLGRQKRRIVQAHDGARDGFGVGAADLPHEHRNAEIGKYDDSEAFVGQS